MWSIARSNGVSLDALLTANPQFDGSAADGHYVLKRERALAGNAQGGRDPDYIRPGETLALPGKASAAPAAPVSLPAMSPSDTMPGEGRDADVQAPQDSSARPDGPLSGEQAGGSETVPPSRPDTPARPEPVRPSPARRAPEGSVHRRAAPASHGQAQGGASGAGQGQWTRMYDVGEAYTREDGSPVLAGAAKAGLSVIKRLEKGDVIRGEKPLADGRMPTNPLKAATSANRYTRPLNMVVRKAEAWGNAAPTNPGKVKAGGFSNAGANILSKTYGIGSVVTNALDIRIAIEKGEGHSIVSNGAELVRGLSDTYKAFAPEGRLPSLAGGRPIWTTMATAANPISKATYAVQGLVIIDDAYEKYESGKLSSKDAAARVFDGGFSATMGILQYVPPAAPVAYTVNTTIGVVEGGAAIAGKRVDVGEQLYTHVVRKAPQLMKYTNPVFGMAEMTLRATGAGKAVDAMHEKMSEQIDQGMLMVGKGVNYVGDGLRGAWTWAFGK